MNWGDETVVGKITDGMIRAQRAGGTLAKLFSPARYWIDKARRSARSGQWDAAARYYKKCLRASHDFAPVWVQYGHALKEGGDRGGAESAYRTALQLAPNPETHLHLGHLLLARACHNEAAEEFLKALRLDPEFAAAHNGLADAGVAVDEIEVALRDHSSEAFSVDSNSLNRVAALVPSIPVRAGMPVADGTALQAAVIERLTECEGAYPNLSVVANDIHRIVGWAFLPFDFHQAPLINVYYGTHLIASAVANRGRPSGLHNGPLYNWFEIIWKEWGLVFDRNGLARLRVQRGEDGRLWHGTAPIPPTAELIGIDALVEAELFDEPASSLVPSPLHHLSAWAIVQLYYLDYLGRAVDASSLARYAIELERHSLTVDDFRHDLLHSDEFRKREIRPHHHLGRLIMTSALSLHTRLAFDRHPPLVTFERVAAAEFLAKDSAQFLDTCYALLAPRGADRPSGKALLQMLDAGRMSRLDVLREFVLRAATAGRFFEITDLLLLEPAVAGSARRPVAASIAP